MTRSRTTIGVAIAAAAVTALAVGVVTTRGEDAAQTTGSTMVGSGRDQPAPGTKPETLLTQSVEGESWSLRSFTNAAGELCFGEKVPGEGQGITCATIDQYLGESKLYVGVGARQRSGGDLTEWDNSWILGLAAPEIDRLELVLTDCSRQPVMMGESGLFLYVMGSGLLHSDVWPDTIIGYDASGNVVAREEVRLEPPDTEAARALGVTAPPSCRER